jgi:hypothetical protein
VGTLRFAHPTKSINTKLAFSKTSGIHMSETDIKRKNTVLSIETFAKKKGTVFQQGLTW